MYFAIEEPDAPPASVQIGVIATIAVVGALIVLAAIARQHLPSANGKFRVLIEWDRTRGQQLLSQRRSGTYSSIRQDIFGHTRRDTIGGDRYCEFPTLDQAKTEAAWAVAAGVDQTGRPIHGTHPTTNQRTLGHRRRQPPLNERTYLSDHERTIPGSATSTS